MEWIDRVLEPFEWMRAVLANQGVPGQVFISGIVVYAIAFAFVALICRWLLLAVAQLTRCCAKRLAVDATLADVVRLEASSARIEGVLLWLATRVVRTSSGGTERITRLPPVRNEHMVLRILRWILRSVWLMLRWVCTFIAAMPGFFLTAFGMAVLFASTLTAFPDLIRAGNAALSSFLETVTFSEATLAAIVAAVIPLMLVIVKVLVSERTVARRSFRRERDVNALKQLHRATPALAVLAGATREQMHEMVHMFRIEKYHAEQWYKWTQRTTPRSRYWNREVDDHVECGRDCLVSFGPKVPVRERSDEVKDAIDGVQSVWNDELRDQKSVLARILTRRAWTGLVSLWFCFSNSGEFWTHKVPSRDEWRRRRIVWQHDQLLWSGPTEDDVAAGREVAVDVEYSPDERWLEQELCDVVWKLAELSRELNDLVDFAQTLTRPSRLERLARVSEA